MRLAVFVAAAWLITAPITAGRAQEPLDGPTTTHLGPSGPWGQLEVTRIVISPPAEYLNRDWGQLQPTRWHFPEMTIDRVRSTLAAAGLPAAQVAQLAESARADVRSRGFIVQPDVAVVRSLSPQTRAKLYMQLGRSELNHAQEAPFRFFGQSPDEWLPPAVIGEDTRHQIDPLIYSDGGFMYFADLDALRTAVTDTDELQRLLKRLLRQVTYVVRLRVDDASRVGEIAEYWGRAGRRLDVKPVLESLAEAGGSASIDVSHLLPALARQHLYRYPRTTSQDLAKPLLANCFWTALNFFADPPDDKFLDVATAANALRNDYYFVHDNLQLGDIVTFSNLQGQLHHVAVYLADDLVFGKNGTSPIAPWTILPIEQIKGHYAAEFQDGWRVAYLRRTGL